MVLAVQVRLFLLVAREAPISELTLKQSNEDESLTDEMAHMPRHPDLHLHHLSQGLACIMRSAASPVLVRSCSCCFRQMGEPMEGNGNTQGQNLQRLACIMRSAASPVLVYSCSLSHRKRPPCSLPRILSSSLLPRLGAAAGAAAAVAAAAAAGGSTALGGCFPCR